MSLNPAAISCAVEADDIAFAEKYGVMNCIECGACSFSCPAYRCYAELPPCKGRHPYENSKREGGCGRSSREEELSR